MISPALTTWPPNRLTPSRWALESRPFLLDDAPFLCAMSGLLLAGAGLAGTDAGDLHLRVLLPVALTAAVASLVFVMNHVDLGAAGGPEDLGGDLVTAERGTVGDDVAVIHDEHGRQRHSGANLTGELVDGEDIVNRCPFLPAAAANDRVHERTLFSLVPACREIPRSRPTQSLRLSLVQHRSGRFANNARRSLALNCTKGG